MTKDFMKIHTFKEIAGGFVCGKRQDFIIHAYFSRRFYHDNADGRRREVIWCTIDQHTNRVWMFYTESLMDRISDDNTQTSNVYVL